MTLDLWMSSASQESQRFLHDFAPKRKALGYNVNFVPHYHVFGMEATLDSNELCTDASAHYCAEDPDGSGPITGKMVLEEDVRQLCVHELDQDQARQASKTALDSYSSKYWEYVQLLMGSCPLDGATPDRRFGRECSERLMDKVHVNATAVAKCASETTDTKLRIQRENAAWSPRAVRINGWRYTGTIDADLVTRALCTGFVAQPSTCKHLVEPVRPFSVEPIAEDGIGFAWIVVVLLLIAALMVGALVLYKRSLTQHIHTSLREEVMLEVQAQMDAYKQMPA